MLSHEYRTTPDSPPLTPPGSGTDSSDAESSSNSTAPTTATTTTTTTRVNPLYSQLHPPKTQSRVIVKDGFDCTDPFKQQAHTTMTTPLEQPALLQQVRSPSTSTITPTSTSTNPARTTRSTSDSQQPETRSTNGDHQEPDGATTTKVSHDEKDRIKSKLHAIKLEAKDKLANVGISHDSSSNSNAPPPGADSNVTSILDRPLEESVPEEEEDEYLSGDETETENEAGPRLGRVETIDSQSYTSGASFYSAESDIGGANSTVESLRRSESPVSFTVDGTSPPRLMHQNGTPLDRSPVAYAPGYVHTNSRLVPFGSGSPSSNRPVSPTQAPSSPRLSIPLPYVSSGSPTPSGSHRLVPTASIVKPSTSHPSLAHLSASQPPPPPTTTTNHLLPTRRASTTSPSLHPPPVSQYSTSMASRRGSSASTLLRPNNSQPPQPSTTTATSTSFPPRSLSASQLAGPSSSSTMHPNFSSFPLPSHSLSYPPLSASSSPIATPIAQSPSLSRGGGGNGPSIHDDVEESIAAQAEQIRRQRLEKRQQAAEQQMTSNSTSGSGSATRGGGGGGTEEMKEKGKAREDESLGGMHPRLGGGVGGGGILSTARRNSHRGGGGTGSMSRTRSGSGLGLGMMTGGEAYDGTGGGSALSTTSLALPPTTNTAPGGGSGGSSGSLAPPVGLGKSPGLRTSSLPHARSGSGGSSLLRDRDSLAVGGAGGRRSISGESTTTSASLLPPPPLSLPASSSTSTLAPPPLHHTASTTSFGAPLSTAAPRPTSSAGLQRTHSQAQTVQLDAGDRMMEKEDGGTGATGIPLVGNLIGTDHENYVLMYNMLTGIRIGVSRCQAKAARPLTDADYTARHKFSFDIVGNELTPSVRYDFKFKDYAPWVFRELREYFFLDPSDYLISLTAKYILSELGSPGKSGSFFYFSRDYRFIIKTIRHSEHKFLRKILKEYHEHVKKNPHTLLSRFYGLHRVKLPHGRKIHFVIMNNLFPPHRDIHETYDLKGSSVGRLYPEAKAAQNPHAVLKDLNWLLRNRQLELGPEKKALFEEQLRRDTELMQKLGIMDYSLLTGVHMAAKGNEERLREGKLSVFQPNAPKPTRKPTQIHRSADASALRAAVQRSDPQSITSGQDLPEHDTSTERRRFLFYQDEGGMRATGEANEDLAVIYYLGIIDILTPYTLVKRLEHFFKGIKNDKHCISAVPPKEYGDRFLNFIRSCIRGNPDSLRPKMWMPPISEETTEEEGQVGKERVGGREEMREREQGEEKRGKEKVQ